MNVKDLGGQLAFALAAVAVGILSCLIHGLLGDLVQTAPGAAITLGLFQNLLVACLRGYASFNSWHDSSPEVLAIGQHLPDRSLVSSIDHGTGSQMTLALGGFLGQDVIQMRL